jgi:bacteriocin-like protein
MTRLKEEPHGDGSEKKQETTISPQPDAEDKKQSAELTEKELKEVAGGTSCATGVHIPKVIIHCR